jgi:hypothetical protein
MDSSGNLYSCGNQWGGSTAGPAIWKRLGGVWQSAIPISMTGYSSNYYNFSCMAFNSTGGVSCVGLYSPASPTYYSELLSWPSLASDPALLASGTALLITDSAAAFDSSGNFLVVGAMGTIETKGRGTWPISDGVPVYWNGTAQTNLPLGSGTYGWARSIAVGP